MSNTITMRVRMVYDHPYGNPNPKAEWIPGAPEAAAGEIVTVPFEVGAKLVASGYAAELPDKQPIPVEPEPFPLEAESESEEE